MSITKKNLSYFAILTIYLFSGAGTFMNAALQTMIEGWPEISPLTVRMVVSIPPLVSLPVILFIGKIVGAKISYRFCAIGGTTLIAIAGVAPYFIYSNWELVLVFRALLGVGVGLLAVRNPLIMLSVPKNKQAVYIGYGTVVMNLGSTIAAPIVGALSQYSWKHPFLFDLIAFIPVIYMLFFLKEPEKTKSVTEKSTENSIPNYFPTKSMKKTLLCYT